KVHVRQRVNRSSSRGVADSKLADVEFWHCDRDGDRKTAAPVLATWHRRAAVEGGDAPPISSPPLPIACSPTCCSRARPIAAALAPSGSSPVARALSPLRHPRRLQATRARPHP